MQEDIKKMMAFSAINKIYESPIPVLEEKKQGDNKYVSYGSDNAYPEYLNSLFNEVTSLRTIIMGTSDFVGGDGWSMNGREIINRKGDELTDFVYHLSLDYLCYGGFAFQVIRDKASRPIEMYYIDFRYVRTDENGEVFWVSKEWGKRYGRTSKALVYPKFIPDGTDPNSIVYVKNTINTVYPIPVYAGSIRACETEKEIDIFHLSGLKNGFAPSFMISFNDGIPDEEQRAEIEREIEEKFCSASNGGRVLITYAGHKDNAVTIEKLDIQDYGEKYQKAAERSRSQIYAAFRATPSLFGLPTENMGFNSQEYQDVFKIFNRTVVKPIQMKIKASIERVFGKDVCTIKPFSIEDKDDTVIK